MSLLQFKNYLGREFDLGQRIIGICGKNGIGKTNLLDAIYYLCFTRSYFTKSDQQNVLQGRAGFRIAGEFLVDAEETTSVCILRENGRKEFIQQGQAYTRFSDHIGKYPCVFVAPDDVHIITEGSEERRKFLDALLSQQDHIYLQNLIDYNRILAQRNSLLRQFAESGQFNEALLEVIDGQLVVSGNFIFERRKEFLDELIPSVSQFYREISGEEYDIKINYESQLLDETFQDLLRRSRDKDLHSQRTQSGIHKDDLAFNLNGTQFKNIASQGQRKSLLFALKLAEFQSLKIHKGFSPILLLDDVFEKLDATRMHNLLEFVCCSNDGQVFLTDTHCARLTTALEDLKVEYQLIDLSPEST